MHVQCDGTECTLMFMLERHDSLLFNNTQQQSHVDVFFLIHICSSKETETH